MEKLNYIPQEKSNIGVGIIDGISISRGIPEEWKVEPLFLEYPPKYMLPNTKDKDITKMGFSLRSFLRSFDPNFYYSMYINGRNPRLKYRPHTRHRNLVKAINL